MFSIRVVRLARYMPKASERSDERRTRIAWLVVVLALLPWAAWAEQAGAAQGRLKYRGKGPVCVCSKGLSESDIQAAERERSNSGSPQGGKTEKTDSPQQPKEQQK